MRLLGFITHTLISGTGIVSEKHQEIIRINQYVYFVMLTLEAFALIDSSNKARRQINVLLYFFVVGESVVSR